MKAKTIIHVVPDEKIYSPDGFATVAHLIQRHMDSTVPLRGLRNGKVKHLQIVGGAIYRVEEA